MRNTLPLALPVGSAPESNIEAVDDTPDATSLPPRYESKPLHFVRKAPDEMVKCASQYAQSMVGRRTVRSFSTEPFPLEILEMAIRAAASAPSGANQQPWTFVVVTEDAIKQQIREAAEAEEYKNWHGRMPAEWVEALAPLGVDCEKRHLVDAPALIIVFAQAWHESTDTDGVRKRIKHYYVDESVGMAVGMLLSALHLAGLATLTHTPSPMRFLRTLLGRPENERAYVVIPVGYPATDATVPDVARKALSEVLTRF
jgi:iodotyrosine deiodinase